MASSLRDRRATMASSLPRNPDPKDGETSIIIYGYIPSLSLGLACCILFGLLCLIHLLFALFDGPLFGRHARSSTRPLSASSSTDLTHDPTDGPPAETDLDPRAVQDKTRTNTRIFSSLLSFGCLMEGVGYGFRARSNGNPYLLDAFILQYFMIVCAPVFFTAAIYLGLATVIRSGPAFQRASPLSPPHLIALFVIADIITIGMQVSGAALFGVAQSKIADDEQPPLSPQSANNILTAGLAVQTFFFTVFLIVFTLFVWRVFQRAKPSAEAETQTTVGTVPRTPSIDDKDAPPPSAVTPTTTTARQTPDRLLLGVMGASSFFIYLRTVFRLAEAIEGVYSESATNEDLFAALEAAPVLVAIVLWAVIPLGWRIRKA